MCTTGQPILKVTLSLIFSLSSLNSRNQIQLLRAPHRPTPIVVLLSTPTPPTTSELRRCPPPAPRASPNPTFDCRAPPSSVVTPSPASQLQPPPGLVIMLGHRRAPFDANTTDHLRASPLPTSSSSSFAQPNIRLPSSSVLRRDPKPCESTPTSSRFGYNARMMEMI
ncbi:uncharacterized protein A4U43_C09F10620 [Asparagus officinalis]|uniref:Uncharacterized protein n=1 Tax=Asparagus officinalis TaxID=4686 RepID=A0A5P1EA06_ASPOF|nr:uncharacterized protein A4U43_C09F10620 [Asparagus officinalis]